MGRLKWGRPEVATDVLIGPSGIVTHPSDPHRRDDQPRVFLGPIASANTLLKDPVRRDALHDRFGAKAVEMEGSGISDASWSHGIGYLVVRGICDYCDANKNNVWQKYAAMSAAAYVRALLESMPGKDIPPITGAAIGPPPEITGAAIGPPPEGGLSPDDDSYIQRHPDNVFMSAIKDQYSVVLIRGAAPGRQDIAPGTRHPPSAQEGARVVFTDLQRLNRSELQSPEAFFRALVGAPPRTCGSKSA